MRLAETTFWPLGGQVGWPEATALVNIAVDSDAGICLGSDANGLLSLLAKNGSLGELTLPRGMAISENGDLLLLVGAQIKRFDIYQQTFVTLPAIGGQGSAPRQFNNPANIACAGYALYVADQGNHRVQVFNLETLSLIHIWDLAEWEPADVANSDTDAYILDSRNGRVYIHAASRTHLHKVIDESEKANAWTRIAIDSQKNICLLNHAEKQLDIYSPRGRWIKTVNDAGQIRDQFALPIIRLNHRGRFQIPEQLLKQCGTTSAKDKIDEAFIFTQAGDRVRASAPTSPLGPLRYSQNGYWISPPLNSDIYQCQWHKIELNLATLPAGSQIRISTFSNASKLTTEAIETLPSDLWETNFVATGEMQPPPGQAQQKKPDKEVDFLIQSREGQYLWVRIELVGDGYSTPFVNWLRVHFPRASYLSYLPAVFSADEDSRWYLERYLSIMQTEWDKLEQTVGDVSGYFDPRAVPEGAPLQYLADWLALPLEGNWNTRQKRNLLQAAPKIYENRGTIGSLKAYLQIYLQNMTGLASETQMNFPQIIEGFRARRFLQFSQEKKLSLAGLRLWGPGIVGRLQLDVFAEVGDVRLVSTGDPERDIFHEYAHRFYLFMPAAWIKTKQDEQMMRRAVETEKPAHASYELCLIEPRFRIERQSTIGFDTIVGDYPQARLSCEQQQNQAPSLPQRHRLGYDMILGGLPTNKKTAELAPHVRVGQEIILA